VDGPTKALVLGVLFVWMASCGAAIIDQELIALAAITTPVISAIIAGVFSAAYLKRRRNGA
jgi:hypothetical protein